MHPGRRDDPSSPRYPLALSLVPIVLAAGVYYPITANYFVYDDFRHLYRMVNLPVEKFLFEPHGGHLLVVRNLVFALFHHLFGTEPYGYFCMVLLTHLVNVWLLFEVIRTFTGSPRVACGGAALWGTGPALVGTLGWYSVYGQVLVATILLGLLLHAGRIVARGADVSTASLGVWYGLLLVATTCFGSGLGVALAFPVLSFLLLPKGRRRARAVRVLASLWIVVPVLYVVDHRLFPPLDPALPDATPWLSEPWLLAQPRYWGHPLAMLLELLGYGVAGVHLNFFTPSLEPPRAVWWSVVAAWVAGAAALLLGGSGSVRRQLLACLVIALATYATIAAGRANLYASMGWTLNPPAILRYHYIGAIPLTLASCLVVNTLAGRWRMRSPASGTLLAAVLGLLVVVYARADWRIDHWDAARRETTDVVRTIRSMVAAHPPGDVVVIPNRPFHAVDPFATQGVFPGWAGVFTIFFPENHVDGRRVYFLVTDPAVLEAARAGRRSATLLVGPPRAEPSGPSTFSRRQVVGEEVGARHGIVDGRRERHREQGGRQVVPTGGAGPPIRDLGRGGHVSSHPPWREASASLRACHLQGPGVIRAWEPSWAPPIGTR